MIAPQPQNQTARIEAIERFQLGADAHSEKMDSLVELAAQITDCPIALVSIVHEQDQRFEAVCGLDIDGTRLESSICSHAILQEELLEIPDCRLDMRTRDNPLVTNAEDPLVFYAGAQIATPEGITLGTLCVLDRKPRRLGDHQRRALRILAKQAMHLLELHDAMRVADSLRREADHRVKNSLSSISAVARMSAALADSDEVRAALEQVHTRIEATARLHGELYRQDMGEHDIEVSDYLDRVMGHLFEIAAPDVDVSFAFEPVRLPSQSAAALGLLVNEMVSNAFKHGFPEGTAGRVSVTGKRIGRDRYALACEDDGVGAAAAPSTSGLGGRLMAASARQLDGEVETGPGPGGRGYVAQVVLTLPGA